MPTITINVNGEEVQEPTTPVTAPITLDTSNGATALNVDLAPVTNDGNIAKVLKITVSNPVNCTVTRVGATVGASFASSNDSTYEVTLQPNKTANGSIMFGFTPPPAGQPPVQATAGYTIEWL